MSVPAHALKDAEGGGLASLTTPWNQEGAIKAAEERLATTLAILREEGLNAKGEVGDMLPDRAIEDALLIFDADTIVISTLPVERSRWLRRSLIEKVKSRHSDKQVIHIVSDVPPSGPGPQDSLDPHQPTARWPANAPEDAPIAPLPSDDLDETAERQP